MARQSTRQLQGKSIGQVSSALGISKDAVRKRIKRGKLTAEKDQQGNWVVYLHMDKQDKTLDNVQDKQDNVQDKSSEGLLMLIEQLKKNNDFLEGQLKAKDEQIKAKDEQIKVKDQQLLNMQILEHGKQQLLLEDPKTKEGFLKRIFKKQG